MGNNPYNRRLKEDNLQEPKPLSTSVRIPHVQLKDGAISDSDSEEEINKLGIENPLKLRQKSENPGLEKIVSAVEVAAKTKREAMSRMESNQHITSEEEVGYDKRGEEIGKELAEEKARLEAENQTKMEAEEQARK